MAHAKQNEPDDKKTAKKKLSPKQVIEEAGLKDEHVKAAHKILKEVDAELVSLAKKDDDSEERVGERHVVMGSFVDSLNGFVAMVIERVAAAAHIVLTKENIPIIRAVIKSMPGEGRLEIFLLFALDQWERNLPDDPNADLTAVALNR